MKVYPHCIENVLSGHDSFVQMASWVSDKSSVIFGAYRIVGSLSICVVIHVTRSN